MTTHMSLKTMPDDNLVLSVGFWVQTIVIHCPDTCFYSLAILTVLFWGWFVWGLFGFWRGSLVGWGGWFLLVLWWVDLVWVFWFWFFCCFGFGFLLGPVHAPPPRKKKKGGGGDKETTMGLFIFNSEVGWIPGQDLVLHKVEHECLGLLTPLEIKPTSSLVWQCNTKYPKQRLLFSILSTQCIQCYHVIYFKCAMICVMSWH